MTTPETPAEYPIVPVTVTNAGELAAHRRRAASCRTIVLHSGDQVAGLADEDPHRCAMYVQALDADVVICHSLAQAADAANGAAALPAPAGTVIPAANTAPYPVGGNDRMWVTAPAASLPCRVSVTTIRYALA